MSHVAFFFCRMAVRRRTVLLTCNHFRLEYIIHFASTGVSTVCFSAKIFTLQRTVILCVKICAFFSGTPFILAVCMLTEWSVEKYTGTVKEHMALIRLTTMQPGLLYHLPFIASSSTFSPIRQSN